nr:hypothetical protein [Scytonema hofmannii]
MMKIPKKSKRIPQILGGCCIASIILLCSTPSYGFSINDFFSDVLGELNGYFEEAKSQLNAKVDEVWGSVKSDVQAAINSSIGEMDLPDPVKGSDQVQEKLKTKGIAAETNTTVGASEAAKQLERETTRATIASVLGKYGQERTAQEIETTKKTVDEAKSLADQAQGMDASQNILKVIAAQNAQIVSMLGQTRTDGLQARHDAQQTNLMLAQIAEQQASQQRKARLQETAAISQQVGIAGWSRLDPSYVPSP